MRGAESIEYRVEEEGFDAIDAEQFTHVVALHPIVKADERLELFKQVRRLLCPGARH